MILIVKCKVTKTGNSALYAITRNHTLSIKYTALFTAHECVIRTGYFVSDLLHSRAFFPAASSLRIFCNALMCTPRCFLLSIWQSILRLNHPFGCYPPMNNVPSASDRTLLTITKSNTLVIYWVCRWCYTLCDCIALPHWQNECVISCTASSIPRNLLPDVYYSTNVSEIWYASFKIILNNLIHNLGNQLCAWIFPPKS